MNEKDLRLPFTTPQQIDSFIQNFDQFFGRSPTREEIRYLRFAQRLLREKLGKDIAAEAASADD